MLSELHIENIAVIERAEASFGPGLNVLTGETGAGKSIVADAIAAVTGGRVSRELVRAGAERALVSAVFTAPGPGPEAWLSENDIGREGDEIILQRRVDVSGRSACRVNGVPVTAAQLRALGSLLLDMHGQNDGRALLDEERHLDYLDRFADIPEEKTAYAAAYEKYRALRREIGRLGMDELEKARLTDSLTREVAELEAAGLRPGETEELEARRALMKNAEKLTGALEGAYRLLYEADENAIGLTSEAGRLLTEAASMAEGLKAAAEGAAQARFLLEDAAERVADFRSSLDFSEAEFAQAEERLSLLRRLSRKYGADETELLTRLEDSRKRLTELASSGDLIAQLEKDAERAKAAVLAAGGSLTKKRASAAEALSKRVRAELSYLNMPSVRFVTEIDPVAAEEGFDATGRDAVRFLLSANAGAPPGRLSRIASGGELSRVMLALMSVFAEKDGVQTLVFDEIDTGVSGVTAQRVGEKMALLARGKQLICITHLPQIAAMADSQFSIEKAEKGGTTYTTVTELDRAGRINELARLYGGDKVTETTRQSAGELMEAAKEFKKHGS